MLITGARGRVGRAVEAELNRIRLETMSFDLVDGRDVTDPDTLAERMHGCAGVVHLAAVDEEPIEESVLSPTATGGVSRIMATNVGGTAQVLAVAAKESVQRVVFMSSVDVLGCFMGQATPRYFPIDDAHPVAPVGPYSWSKLAGEELCAAFTRATAVPTVCIRAPGVFDAEVYEFIRVERARRPEFEWSPVWEYGAFIDARDLATAVGAGLLVESLSGHHRVIVCANDITSARDDGLTLTQRLLPEVPIRRPDRYTVDRFTALVDNTGAKSLLGWQPVHSWRPDRHS